MSIPVPYPFVPSPHEHEHESPATMTLKPRKAVFCIDCGVEIAPGYISGLWCPAHYTREKAALLAHARRCNLCGGTMPPQAPDSNALRLAHGACLEMWIHDLFQD